MSDLRPMGLRANGTSQAADPDVTRLERPSESLDETVIDERLDALMERVRNWDWRAYSPGAGRALEDAVPPVTSEMPAAAPSIPVREDPEPLPVPQMESIASGIDSQQMVFGPIPETVEGDATPIDVVQDPPDVDASSSVAPPPPPTQVAPPHPLTQVAPPPPPTQVAPPPPPTQGVPPSSEFAAPATSAENLQAPQSPDLQVEADSSTLRHQRFSRVKVGGLYAAAAVAVLLVIEGIRVFG